MPLFHAKNLSLAYGDVKLLDAVDLSIDAGERIALVGRNGTGKSSLLKIIAGQVKPDDGESARGNTLKLGYVPQEPTFEACHTVFEAVAAGLGDVSTLLIDYHHAVTLAGQGDEQALVRMGELQQALEQANGWQIERKVEMAISTLNLDADRELADLSGGTLKRVALARAWVAEPELLLLDEPTNHLDITSIDWLEKTLSAFPGAVLVISHDRRFLETFATRIIELDRGKLASFPGSFAEYERRKDEMLNAEALANARFDKLLKEEETWIRKGVEARRTRSAGRVTRLHALRQERSERRARMGNVKFSVADAEKSGKIVAELTDVSKSFTQDGNTKQVLRGFTAIVQRGDRIGLIGPNGAGKSTLMKIMLGEMVADEGRVKRGTQLSVAYFDQFREALDDEATLSDVISPGSEFIDTGSGRKHVISYLGDFLFPPQRARAKVKSLSGGERNRLLLARLFAKPANFLVLDEPTNDLDIETLDLLEELLQGFSGTVMVASHDRTFLDNIATQVYVFESEGVVREYAGGYSDWQLQKPAVANMGAVLQKVAVESDREPKLKPAEAKRDRKLSTNEARELGELPARIDQLEQEAREIEAALGDPAHYREPGGAAKIASLQSRLATVRAESERAMQRWEELEAVRALQG
jgi:ABC transport system ATP-binding/permease protein